MRPVGFTFFTLLAIVGAGCAPTEFNPTSTSAENESLSGVIQLTSNFDRAGEAYFSHDMQWIIFQASPRGEPNYQMYLAPVKTDPASRQIVGIGLPIRISPENSRNTCGYFSPDGNTLIFASTAGKEDPSVPTAGYQRQGRDYRWSFPAGMEIYRADGWQGAIAAAEPGKITNLAKNLLTFNNAYDAECAISPDGKWIVFTSNRTGDLELFAMRLDGTTVVQLTHTPGYDGGPFFSPDGKRLVYRSDRQKNDLLQIFTSDLTFDGNGNITGMQHERKLTNDAGVNWGPYWHPDGRHIIYATSGKNHTNYDLILMRDDGSYKTRITFNAATDILPVFSPDGKYLMWTSTRTGQAAQIYLAKFTMPPGV